MPFPIVRTHDHKQKPTVSLFTRRELKTRLSSNITTEKHSFTTGQINNRGLVLFQPSSVSNFIVIPILKSS